MTVIPWSIQYKPLMNGDNLQSIPLVYQFIKQNKQQMYNCSRPVQSFQGYYSFVYNPLYTIVFGYMQGV